MELLIYIVAIMVFYDFSLHLIELCFGQDSAKKFRHYWPTFSINGRFDRKKYTLFWTAYWGLALIFILAYIFY